MTSANAAQDNDTRLATQETRAHSALERLEMMVIDLRQQQASTEAHLIPERDALKRERDDLAQQLAQAKEQIATLTSLTNALSTRIDASIDQLEKAVAA